MTIETAENNLEEKVEIAATSANRAWTGSLAGKIDRFSDSAERFTGTLAGEINYKRFLGFIGVVCIGTIAAGNIPDHDTAKLVSEGIGAAGGALFGDVLRPVSRIGEFDSKKFLKRIDKGESPKLEEVIRFFATFPDFLTEDEIRTRLLGHLPKPTQIPPEDPRYKIIDGLSIAYRQNMEKQEYEISKKTKTWKPRTKEQRAEERKSITRVIMGIQLQAQLERGDESKIREEGAKRLADIGLGIFALFGTAATIDALLQGTGGGLVGIVDELAFAAGIAISATNQKLREYGANPQGYTSRRRSFAAQPVIIDEMTRLSDGENNSNYR